MGVIDAIEALDGLAATLRQPLTQADMEAGWTNQSQQAAIDGLDRLRADLSDGWGDFADYSSHHLVRVFDHWGVVRGDLLGRLAALQEQLIEIRPSAL